MFGNYGFSHHQRGQKYSEVVAGAEAEQSADLRALQSSLDHPAEKTLDTSKGTLGVGNGDNVGEVGADSFPLPVADANQ